VKCAHTIANLIFLPLEFGDNSYSALNLQLTSNASSGTLKRLLTQKRYSLVTFQMLGC